MQNVSFQLYLSRPGLLGSSPPNHCARFMQENIRIPLWTSQSEFKRHMRLELQEGVFSKTHEILLTVKQCSTASLFLRWTSCKSG